jgi:hypothetical protein
MERFMAMFLNRRKHLVGCRLLAMFFVSALPGGWVNAEITLEGAPRENIDKAPREPVFQRVEKCNPIAFDDKEGKYAQLLSKEIRKISGLYLRDYSDFPSLVSIDDCGAFVVISSVLGQGTFGSTWKLVLGRQEFFEFQKSSIPPTRVILFNSAQH